MRLYILKKDRKQDKKQFTFYMYLLNYSFNRLSPYIFLFPPNILINFIILDQYFSDIIIFLLKKDRIPDFRLGKEYFFLIKS